MSGRSAAMCRSYAICAIGQNGSGRSVTHCFVSGSHVRHGTGPVGVSIPIWTDTCAGFAAASSIIRAIWPSPACFHASVSVSVSRGQCPVAPSIVGIT